MELKSIGFTKNNDYWVSEPFMCNGGDVRVRIHKRGPYPVEVLVSIDGAEEYIKYDDFGLDELRSEVTLEGAMCGQYIKFASRSEITLIKTLEL